MSDTLSQVSGASKATNRNKAKICAYCGKAEKGDWARHFKRQHHGKEKIEWVQDEPLLEQPWCENWKEVALNEAKPNNLRSEFKPSTSAANSKRAASIASRSQVAQSIAGDVPMNINEEEKVDIRAVPPNSNFGAIEQTAPKSNPIVPRSVLGKRSPPKAHSLEQAVQEDQLEDIGQSLKLSASNLKRIKQVQVEQKVAQPQFEFAMPDPLPQTSYVNQGMRDQQAIQQLKALETKKDGIADVQAMELIEIAPYFAQPTVSSYIELAKGQLTHVKDLLLLAQTKIKTLSEEEITSIAFASVLFGGSCWDSLPEMLSRVDSHKLEQVLLSICPYLATKFGDNLAQWVCTHWKYLESQTLVLLRYLKEQHLKDSLSSDIATISRMVRIVDPQDYCVLVKGFSKYPAFTIVLDSLNTFALTWKSEQKLQFDEFCSLIGFLNADENEQLIKTNESKLVELPLDQWLSNLLTWQVSSKVCDVESVQYRLNQLQELYGQLPPNHAYDLLSSVDHRYKRTFHPVVNAPNALQFANAQYAAFSLVTYPRQMWCVPSGWGKSRILSATALILLLSGSTTKVHLVFDSEYLLKRDQIEFRDWWVSTGLEQSVEYHIGLDFVCKSNDVVLIDEADEFILSDPSKFSTKIKQGRCICLTATPDNEDKQGVEREVLKKLGFSMFDGQPTMSAESGTVTSVSNLKVNETLPFDSCSDELILFIQKTLKECAVLLYCSPEFLKLLADSSIKFFLMKDGGDFTDELLRTLDDYTYPERTYTLIVAPGSFGMRGFDYRAKQKGITLILADSFSNQRQAMQGLNRVGRFGDPCKRVITRDTPLIDKEKQLQYIASLSKYLNQTQKDKITVTLKEEKKKASTTTNTAKSTPAIGKSIKQTSKSSQSTITMPAKKNLNRRQTDLLGMIGAKTIKKVEEPQKEVEEIVITSSQLL